ncbi:MAG TPA: hypothetical protein VFT56_01910 [Sphingomonas sp.]|nr:hypothetical protein [Sphingomonas sp.]
MDRPASIVRFEQLYLAGFAVGVINTVISWSASQERLAASIAMFGPAFLPIAMAIGFAITLLLWYFIARRGSAIAKWIATVFAAFAAIGLVIGLVRLLGGGGAFSVSAVLGYVASLLQIAAVTFLFRPDTRAWFGEPAAEGAADEAL